MRVLLPNRSKRTVALCPEDTRERRKALRLSAVNRPSEEASAQTLRFNLFPVKLIRILDVLVAIAFLYKV
ncbi:MAG: hypothetical protein KME40_29270 [Komarekiella atlantica HA4396-MV6]|jgi:hypothetical protein|nr:hypothetical protein [Komarekiella atlantica HA4396-MV6]